MSGAFDCADGLSPLARGTHFQILFRPGNVRFIPAGAGNTARRSFFTCLTCGLSPLARGTLKKTQHYTTDARFIPAGAGNTVIARLSMCAGAVYPRWRGEHPMTLFYSFPFIGLSPLARGTHFNPHLFLLLRRFIPAGAGNTGSTRPRRAAAPVYPRWRGEHLPAIYLPVAAFGLSPLARGTLLPIASRARIARFIPAGAGNTELRHWQ